MKRIFIVLLPIVTLAAVSCTKKLSVDMPSLSISLDPARQVADTFVYKLGDTTNFIFTGSAGNIAFYPGDAGRAYDNRNRALALGAATLSFSSKAEFGTQTNTLQLLATNKLKTLDSTTIVNAGWTDITGRAALASSATVVNSGNVNLTDLVSGENDSLFIAFKYTGVTGSTQRTWTITNFTVNNVLPDVTYNTASLAADASYWTRYGNVWNPANGRWTATTAQLQVVGGGATSPNNTSWIISKALYLGRVSPDISIGLKSINNPDLTVYPFKYAAAGTYKASFVVFNNTVKEQETVVKQFYIKVTP
jgi:hypothetical protein